MTIATSPAQQFVSVYFASGWIASYYFDNSGKCNVYVWQCWSRIFLPLSPILLYHQVVTHAILAHILH